MIELNEEGADTAQDPKPKQEPKPSAPQPQEPQAAPQEPAAAPPGPPPVAPPDFSDKLARLLAARGDAFTQALVDDRGRVLREPMTPEDGLRNAMEYLPRYLQSEGGSEAIRAFMSGGQLPVGWVPPTKVVKSHETQEAEWRAQYSREQNPAYHAVRDYVIDPLGNFGFAFLQVPVDLAVGGLRHLGIAPPDASLNLKERFVPQSTRDEMAALSTTAGVPAKVAQGAGEFVGMAGGMTTGSVGKLLGMAGSAVGKAGNALFGSTGKAIGHGAGVFAAYEGVVAEPGKVVEGVAHGAAAGAAMGMAQKIASLGLRALFRTPVKALGPDEKGVMDSLKKWATENKLFAQGGESATAYEKRLVDTWIGAGLPGAPAMPARKLIAASMRGGADALGFSLLDQQFREDLIDAAWHGNSAKWESVVTKFGGNFLGAAALHMPLTSIVPWQRRQAFGKAEPVKDEGVPIEQADFMPELGAPKQLPAPKETPSDPLQLPAPKETRAEALTREQNAKLEAIYTERWDTLLNQTQTQGHWEQTIGASLDNVIPLGWRPSEKSVRERPADEPASTRAKFELPQSGHSFTIDGEVARPSPAMRQALGVPTEMPARELVDAVEKASLVSALTAKAELPGAEIQVGVKAVPGRGNEPGIMRRVVMGEIQESPLQAAPNWTKVEAAPARSRDAIEPEQADAVAALRTVAETSDTLQPADRALLNGAINVLDSVAARNDQAVAETVAAMPKLLDGIAGGEPEAIKALAESLTTKVPEKALDDAQASAEKMTRRERLEARAEKRRNWAGKAEAAAAERFGAADRATSGIPFGQPILKGHHSERRHRAALERMHDNMRAGVERAGMAKRHNEAAKNIESALERSIFKDDADAIPKLRERIDALEAERERRKAVNAAFRKGDAAALESLGTSMQEAQAAVAKLPHGFGMKSPVPYPSYSLQNLGGRIKADRDRLARLEAEARPEQKPDPEAGFIDVEPVADAARAAVEGMEAGFKTSGNIVAKAWNAFQQSQIQKVEAAGRRAEAEMGRDATTATKRIQSQLDTAGLMDLRRMPRKQLDSLAETVSDGIGGSASLYARAMDRGMAQHFGEAKLTPEQQAVVDKGRAVTQESGKIAEELGIEQTDSSGKNPRPFKFDPERRVLVREYSPEMAEARLKRSGPLYDAMVKWLGDKYGWTPEEAGKQFADVQSLTSLDATEVRRSIPVVPEFLEVPGAGSVRVLEGRPLEHAERLAFRSSQVLGARSVMPRFAEKPGEGAQTFPTPPGLEPLSPTAQQLVDRVLNESGPDAAQAVANMVRAMHGLPLKRTPSMFAPGEVGYHTAKVVNNLFGLAKASALSMSFPMNLAEPLTNAAHFGMSGIGHGYREAVRAIATGKFADLHRQAVAEGFIADTKLNDPWRGDTTVETVENSLKKAGEILTTPLRMTQDVNELVNYVAARERLAEMRAGNGSKADANALSLLGFKRPEIDAMLRGQGTAQQYERYQRNIVGELAGGRSQRSAQKSAAGLSAGFNSMVWFTNFFQARSRVTDRLVRDIADAPDAAAKWAKVQQLTKFLALTGLGGLAGNVARQFITGGEEGVEDYLREKQSGDFLDVTRNIAGLIASGVVGGIGTPIADVFGAAADALPSAVGLGSPEQARAAREQLGATAVRLAGPLDTVLRIAEGGLQSAVPAARAVNEGLFGLGAIAITDKSVDLDNAQDSYYRWLRANRPSDFGRRGGSEEQRQFRESMRAVVDKVAAGKEWGDQELVEAVVEAEAVKLRNVEKTRAQKLEQGAKPDYANLYNEARAAVVASLRSRKILPKPGEFPTEQVESLRAHLGEKHLQTLRDHDAVIELLAKRVQGANLRRQVEERR